MNNTRGPWLLIGAIFKLFGWKADEIVLAFSMNADYVITPEHITLMANMFGMLADFFAIVAFMIAIYHFVEKHFMKRK